MSRARITATINGSRCGKLAFAVLVAIAFCLVQPASTAYAKKKVKKPTHGTIKVQTNPGGYALQIDGQSRGTTTTDYQEFELAPGMHSVVITLPNGQTWSRDVEVIAGRRKCVALNYRPPVVVAKSPC